MREPQRRYSQGQLPGSDAFIAAAVLALLLARAIVFSPDGLVLPQPVRALLLLAATALGARARAQAQQPARELRRVPRILGIQTTGAIDREPGTGAFINLVIAKRRQIEQPVFAVDAARIDAEQAECAAPLISDTKVRCGVNQGRA